MVPKPAVDVPAGTASFLVEDLSTGSQHNLCAEEFRAQFVESNRPALIHSALSKWPALKLWTAEYLLSKLMREQVTAAVTPDGRADALARLPSGDTCFALPLECNVPFREALAHMSGASKGAEVWYVQHQNSSLTTQFVPLLPDIDDTLCGWACQAFRQAQPEASNFWLGTSKASTSYHKDPYENMYCMVKGQKHFRLLPSSETSRMEVCQYPVARYQRCLGGLQPVLLSPPQFVPWSAVDPRSEGCEARHPRYCDSSLPAPVNVTLSANQALYLPACYWHHVEQQGDVDSGIAVAVNYWFDVEDEKLLSLDE